MLTCMGSDYKTYMKCNGTELSIIVKNKYYRAFSIFAMREKAGLSDGLARIALIRESRRGPA